MTRPTSTDTARAFRVLAAALCTIALASLASCKNRQASDDLARVDEPSPAAPRTGWFRRKGPPPRNDQLDSARYLGAGAPVAESAAASRTPGLPDVALLQTEPLEPAAPDGSAAITDERWRPEWWLEQPTRDAGLVSVCALGDAPDLLTARKKAMELARDLLKRELGGSRPPDAPAARADSVRMPDKRFRAFVRLSAPLSR